MSNVFGTATTTLTKKTNTIQDSLLSLSDGAMEVLVRVLDRLEENSLSSEEAAKSDPRGVYIEHDKGDAKPNTTKDVLELVKSGLVQSHIESSGGVHFLTANTDVMYSAAEIGAFMMMDLRP